MSETYQSFEGTEKGQSFTLESNSRSVEQMSEALKPVEKAPETPEKAASEPEKDSEAPEPQESAPVEGKQPKRPRDDPKARVAEATRNAAEAKKRIDEVQRRAEAAEAELQRIRASQMARQEPEQPKQSSKPQPDGRPKLDDFDSIEDHAEAMAKWVRKVEREAEESAAKARAYEQFRQKRVTTFADKMSKHLEADPQFWERVSPDVVNLRPLSVMDENEPKGPLNLLAEHFLTSDDPAALIQYFSDSPEEVKRFSQFQTEAQFWREVGKVETRIGSAATTASATVPEISKAAPPARPVTGGPPTGSPDPNKMTFEEYAKWQSLEDAKERKRRR